MAKKATPPMGTIIKRGPGASNDLTITDQTGIQWSFLGTPVSGQYVNGDYWVLGPVTITNVNPGWDGSRNGSCIDPVAGNTPLSQAQTQPYSSAVNAGIYAYSATNPSATRVDFPLTINPSGGIKSLISTAGFSSQNSGGAYETIRTAAVLTILSSPPAANSFRPPYCNVSGVKPQWNTSQVNYGVLPDLVSPGGTPPSLNFNPHAYYAPCGATSVPIMSRVWLDHGGGFTLSNGDIINSVLHPAENMPVYGYEFARLMAQMAAYTLLRVADAPSKTLVANRLIQLGIDNYACSLTNHSAYMAGAGFGHGRKLPILYAGFLLNDSGMKAPATVCDGTGTITPTGERKFGEDGHTYIGAVTGSYPSGAPMWGRDDGPWGITPPFTNCNTDSRDPSGVLFPDEYIGTGLISGSCTDPSGPTYRLCCTSPAWPLQVVVARNITGMETAWGWAPFFSYVTRWVANPTWWPQYPSNQDTFGYGGDGSGWATAMWSSYA